MSSEVEQRDFKVRAGERQAAGQAVSIRIPGRGRAPATVSNLSTNGIGLATSHLLPIGTTVHLSIHTGFDVPLQVQWQLGDRAGARFKAGAGADMVVAALRAMARGHEDAA